MLNLLPQSTLEITVLRSSKSWELKVFILAVRFVWDEARYPTMSPLREIVDGIQSQIAKIEDDLKVS